MKLYLDVCCFNRPFDDHSQDRVHLESEAVTLILLHIREGRWELVSSDVVDLEIEKTVDQEKLILLKLMIKCASQVIKWSNAEGNRARELKEAGFGAMDALHLACAEKGLVDVFLTTDDKLLKGAQRGIGNLSVTVSNPIDWLREVKTR